MCLWSWMLLFDLSFLWSQILLTTKCLVLQRSITSNAIFPTIIVPSCSSVRGLWKLIGAKVFWVSGVCSCWPDHCFLVQWHSNLNYLASSFYWYWIFLGLALMSSLPLLFLFYKCTINSMCKCTHEQIAPSLFWIRSQLSVIFCNLRTKWYCCSPI